MNSSLHSQRPIDNQAVRQLLQANAEALPASSTATATTRFGHDFSRIPTHSPAAGAAQTKQASNKPGDEYKPEADRVAEQVVRASESQFQRARSASPKRQIEQSGQEQPGLQGDSNDSGPTALPSSVHEVVRSAGQPLNAATREFMEPRFGYDFSEVRVHTDAKAAESARDLDASAYTVGSNIVFGADQFMPESPTGRQLLSHELTHVVQQRGAPVSIARGVSAAGDFHEHQAGAVAEALARGNNIAPLLDAGSQAIAHSVQRQPAQQQQPAQQPAPQPLKYDRAVKHVAPVRAGQTVDHLRTLLQSKISHHDITSYSIKGGTGNERIFLLSLILSLGEPNRWGTEADLVTEIDWPSQGSGPAPRGQVTVRIDANGVASAELIARGVPAATQQTTDTLLKTNFNLAAVTDDGTATWSPTELNDVGEAFSLLPAADRAALDGVELIRVATIPGHPNDGGQFEFLQPIAVRPELVTTNPKLRLANRAFENNDLQFFGGSTKQVPASFQTILHEVGHAVESEVYRSAWKAHAQAWTDTKAAGNVQESDARKRERKKAEDKLKAARSRAQKRRWENKIAQFDLEHTNAANDAIDRKAIETNLKAKETEVLNMDAAGQTDRLTKFLDVVNRNHIAPFTSYAQQGDKEFYAEAYSLWIVDPEFLRTNYRVVFDFFQNGDYRR